MSPSIWQILIVVGIIALLFGAKRIPQMGKSLGEGIRGFKKGLTEDEIDVTDSAKKEQIDRDATSTQTQSEKVTETDKA